MYCDVCIKAGPDIVGKAEFVTGKKKVYIWNFRKSCLSESGSFRPDYLFAPGRFAPLNHYYIIIDEVFFNNFLVIIYLLHVVVCKKNNNSFILVYFNYLFISCIQKKIIHSFWSTFVNDLKQNFSYKIYKKTHKNSKKFFFGTNAKVHEMTKMLYKCANNLQFNELCIKC